MAKPSSTTARQWAELMIHGRIRLLLAWMAVSPYGYAATTHISLHGVILIHAWQQKVMLIIEMQVKWVNL